VERKRKKRQRTEGLAMSLTTPPSVQKLRTALHDKAKGSPNFRFYALYDKVYREDAMAFAYEFAKRRKRGDPVKNRRCAHGACAIFPGCVGLVYCRGRASDLVVRPTEEYLEKVSSVSRPHRLAVAILSRHR
jgi:hypothetical protein